MKLLSYIFLLHLFINLVLSYDFIVVEPQESNLQKNITVRIYYELGDDDVEDIVTILETPDYEIETGYLTISDTSAIHILNGLAKEGYSVVGYARNGYDRWTLQRIDEES